MPKEAFIYGGLSAVAAEVVSFPLDTTKIRLQIQGQLADANLTDLKYRGMSHTLFLVAQEEGMMSLYSGVKYAALRQATYGTIRFGIFFTGKSWWLSKGGKDTDLYFTISLGALGGAVSSLLTTPIDMFKVRSQSSQSTKNRPIIQSFYKVYQHAGIKGLYQGKWPNAKRAALVNGAEIPSYVFLKSSLINKLQYEDSFRTHFISATFASLMGVMVSQPADVAKTRIMHQRPHHTDIRQYKGFWDVVRYTARTEGIAAMWKGVVPAWCRNGPWNITFYLVLEQFRRFDVLLNRRDKPLF